MVYCHLKMEGIYLLCDLQDWDCLTRLDLKDAYLNCPIHLDSRRFLRFIWCDRAWQFTCLLFGLSSAPRCFTKIMKLKPIMAFFRSKGIWSIILFGRYPPLLLEPPRPSHPKLLCHQLASILGFSFQLPEIFHLPFSMHRIPRLQSGFSLCNSSRSSFKISAIKKELHLALWATTITLRTLARLVGLQSASIQAIFPYGVASLGFRL